MPWLPTRRTYFGLALAFICFAIYGSLIPFHARSIAAGDAADLFARSFARWPEHVSRSDFLANVLLFVPIGFTVTGALLVDRRPPRRMSPTALLLALVVSAVLSVSAEFVQTFTIDRSSSAVDVLAQMLGCTIGIVGWAIAGPTLHSWLRQTFASAPDDRLARVLAAYVLGWILLHLAPFDVTLDVGDLARRVRDGSIALAPRDAASSRAIWDALAELLAAIPVGAAAAKGWSFARPSSRLDAVALGVGVVLALEAAQVVVQSHSALVTDALFASVGVAIGASATGFLPASQLSAPHAGAGVVRAPVLGAFLLWCAVLAMYHWQPYDFSMNARDVERKLASVSLVPFSSYSQGQPLNAFNDLLTKISLAAPLGLIAAFVARPHLGRSRVAVMAWTGVFAAVFGALECGQFFVPSRYPDPTDVLIGTVAAVAGLLTGQWLSASGAEGTASLRARD